LTKHFHIPIFAEEGLDTTVYKTGGDRTLTQLHHRSNREVTCLENAFIDWLSQLCGKENIERFKKESAEDYTDLIRRLESELRSSFASKPTNIFRAPNSILKYEHTIKDRIVQMNLSADVKLRPGKIQLSHHISRSWFQVPLYKAIRYIYAVLNQPSMHDVNNILIVGDLVEYSILREAMKAAFSDKTVVIPHEQSVAVLKGAVLFGHQLSK